MIAEMGGKNAIIVDDDADLDEAVLGVVKSAFGYQGQKCSACSRAIVLDRVYDAFLERLVEATRSLKVGPAERPGDERRPGDRREIRRAHPAIHRDRPARRRARCWRSMSATLPSRATMSARTSSPTCRPNSRLAQEEIFGPVLAVIRAEGPDRGPRDCQRHRLRPDRRHLLAQPGQPGACRARVAWSATCISTAAITGALVGRQPFGGFKMSGIGSKAGGPDYLLQFVLPRTITENTLRRGFAPPTQTEASPRPIAGE